MEHLRNIEMDCARDADDLLRARVWGYGWRDTGPNALHVLVYRTRRRIRGVLGEGPAIQKRNGHTRLVGVRCTDAVVASRAVS